MVTSCHLTAFERSFARCVGSISSVVLVLSAGCSRPPVSSWIFSSSCAQKAEFGCFSFQSNDPDFVAYQYSSIASFDGVEIFSGISL